MRFKREKNHSWVHLNKYYKNEGYCDNLRKDDYVEFCKSDFNFKRLMGVYRSQEGLMFYLENINETPVFLEPVVRNRLKRVSNKIVESQ